jgi:flagellar hook assembly protein FlgD
MFDVATNEYHDEFIEIFNLSYFDTVDCTGWTFSDSSGVDSIVPHRGGNKIAPRNFALLLDGSYFNNSATYDSLLADSLIILKTEDNSFGKNGLANSKAEWLTIRDSNGRVVTEYTYSIGNKPGYSDEKIDLDETIDSLNWSDSKLAGGTPGRRNSVSPPLYDFGFGQNSLVFPIILFAGDKMVFTLEIFNFGVKSASDSLEIIVFSDLNKDMIYQIDDQLISNRKVPTTAQKIFFEWDNMPAGEHQVVAQLYFSKDEDLENNLISKTIRIIERDVSLHINEIKFLSGDKEPEWIELINLSDEKVLLKDWSLADLSDTVSIDSQIFLESGKFIVLSEDTLSEFYKLEIEKILILSKFPTLNDQEDEIILMDPTGSWKERVRYEREWLEGEDFRLPSLERIHPLLYENKAENWGPCINQIGATPGQQNSIFSELTTEIREANVSPNPFSPNSDGLDDVTIISGQIPESSARIKVEVYDTRGRLIQTLKDNRFSGSHFNLVWDGRDRDGRIARIGIYIIYIQALNDRLGVLREMRTTVVLAQKL